MLSSKIKYNELTSISYFTADQLNFADAKLDSQLRDSALEVDARQCKNALAQMFTIETTLVKKNTSWVVQ